jgi:predicted nucleotidyltransferase
MHALAVQAQGEEVLAAALRLARQRLGERLVAAYALGSLAHGGFSPVSDVDLGLVLADPLREGDEALVAGIAKSIKESGRPFADRLSVFWGSPGTLSGSTQGGRFPPLDRLDLIQYGRLLAGSDLRARLAVPDRSELVLAGAEFALSRLGNDATLAKLKRPDALAAADARTLSKLILFPIRFLYTARTGEVGRNEAAVAHFTAGAQRPATHLARLALEWRTTGAVASKPTAAEALATGLVPLYREFIADHERRMQDYGRADLAHAFGEWRQRLLERPG